MNDDLIDWFAEANGFSGGTKAPHKWVLQAEQELRIHAAALSEAQATIARQQVMLDRALESNGDMQAEIARLRGLVPNPDETRDEIVWRDYMRGVHPDTLAKQHKVTRERMRHMLRRITERRAALEAKHG